MASMKKNLSWISPAVILLASFLLRISLISKGPYHVDCLNLALKAQETLDTGVLQNLFGSGYPLTVLLGAVFIGMGRLVSVQDPVIMVNFMSVVFSSLAVFLLYYLGKNLFNVKTGFFSAILYSVTPIFLGISVYGKSHAPNIFFLLLCLWLLTRFRGHLSFRYLGLAALAFGCAGATRLQDMVLMVPATAYFLATMPQPAPQRLRAGLAFFGLAGLLGAGFHLPYLFGPDAGPFLAQFGHFWDQGVTHSFRGVFSPALGIACEYLWMTLSFLGLGLSVFGLLLIGLNDRRACVFLLLWFGVPLLFYGNLWTIAPRFFAFCLVPLFLGQGYLLSRFFSYKPTFRIPVILFTLFLLFYSVYQVYAILLLRHQRALLPEYVRWVQQTVEEDAVIIVGSDSSLFFKHYGPLKVTGRPIGQFSIPQRKLARFGKKIDSFLKTRTPLYISFNSLHVYDPLNQFSSFMGKNYRLEPVGGHLVEFWHKDSFRPIILYDTLFRILPK
jgi:hypothetical protein